MTLSNAVWERVRLADVLTYLDERVDLEENKEYLTITVKRRHGGLEMRERLFGHEIKTKKQFRLVPGSFIISRIQCWHQAYAIVGDVAANAIASINYDQFAISPEVHPRFFWWLSYTPEFTEIVRSSASGVVIEKMVFNRTAWLEKTVLIPPFQEQRRIVARIEELFTQIQETRALRQQALEQAEALVDSTMNYILSRATSKTWEYGTIPEFAEVNPSRIGRINLIQGDMVSFVPMKAVDDATGTIACPEIRTFAEVSKGYTWFTEGDVIFARITPCMQNGKSAIARGLQNGTAFGSTEFHVIRPGSKLTAEWLHALVRHKAFLDDASTHFKGTAGQQRVPQSFLETKLIPVPSLSEQRCIVDELDKLQSEVDALKRLQAETAIELDALLPSILDRAFKGEL